MVELIFLDLLQFAFLFLMYYNFKITALGERYNSMEDLKPIIAKNIIDLRKSMSLTQAELAQKLNYTDKAVSKWERAESVPDVAVLKEIANIFDVNVDYLLQAEHKENYQVISKQKRHDHLIITLLSASLVFLIATVLFVSLESTLDRMRLYIWMIYIYAIPVACIVLLVFNSLWGKRKTRFIIISVLLWSALLSLYLSFLSFVSHNIWLVFMIGIPAQIIIFLWANLKKKIN